MLGVVFIQSNLKKIFTRWIDPWIIVVPEGAPSALEYPSTNIAVKRLQID